MKYKINKRILESHVGRISKIASRHLTLPVLSCVYMEVVDKDKLILRTTNLDMGIEVSIKIDSGEVGVVAVPSSVFFSTISAFKGEILEIENVEGNLKVKSEKNNATLKCLPHEDFPSIPKMEDAKDFVVKNSDFMTGIKSVVYAASQSSIKPELASVYVYNDSGVMVFVSTDSFRLAEKRIQLAKDIEFDPIIIPFKNAIEIIKIFDSLSDELKVSINKNQLAISGGDVSVVSRLIDGSFPDYKQIIPKVFNTEVAVLKNDLLNSIKASMIFSDNLSQVKLTVSKEGFVVEAKNNDVGEYNEKIESKISGDGVSLNFNSKYISECFQSIASETLNMSFAGSGRPLMIKGASDNGFLYIVMPMNR